MYKNHLKNSLRVTLSFIKCVIAFLFIITTSCDPTVLAQEFILKFPVDCQLNRDCYIFHYVDRDPTSGFADFKGGRLTFDGHKGTDIAVKTYEQMRQRIAVLAAAEGVVLRVRDGEIDYQRNQGDIVKGRECGNGLILSHKWGYKSQYCHLLNNSIVVKPGEKVSTGQVLGFLGSSGKADFPHLHFARMEVPLTSSSILHPRPLVVLLSDDGKSDDEAYLVHLLPIVWY